MNRQIRPRILVATALAALLAGGVANAAIKPPHDAGHDRQHQRKEHRQDKRADHRKPAKAVQAQRSAHRASAQRPRNDRRPAAQAQRHDRRPGSVQAQQIAQAQRAERRANAQRQQSGRHGGWNDRRDDRHDRNHRNDRHDAQRRIAYARYRNDYDRRFRSHVHVRIVPRYYVHPGHYRYSYGGRWYTTSNYGAEMLRMAVENGYREGLRAGRADRFDGWPGGFRDSFAWRDASFGYGPGYISRADYAYYFRQGFERGYDDGYFGRMRYGHYVGSDAVIIGAVLAAILNVQLLR